MITLVQIAGLWGGGEGSGCHGPNCGRPLSPKEQAEFLHKQFVGLKRQESNQERKKWVGEQIQKHGQVTTKAGKKWWKKEAKRQAKLPTPDPARRLPKVTKKGQKWLQKNALQVKKGITGIQRYGGKETIKLQLPRKGQIKKQFVTADGTKLTIIKPPKQREKTGETWLKRESPYKNKFVQHFDIPAGKMFQENAKVAFFMARDAEKERAVAVQVLRNFGEKTTAVTEIDLLSFDAIARSRQATFSNMGKAAGFLAKRYGISLKFG